MSRYDNTSKIQNKQFVSIGTSYLPKHEEKNSDILLIATEGDKCDLISQQYYGTTEYWWYIASVNNLKSNNIEAGTQLRVPISTEQAKLR
jgi:LysM repeat protein|tara:strand:- start:3591 stop:3860 length:270 start_codon:yes stop_codon:yes gene_type:complete